MSTRRAASRACGVWSPRGQDIWLCSLATSGTPGGTARAAAHQAPIMWACTRRARAILGSSQPPKPDAGVHFKVSGAGAAPSARGRNREATPPAGPGAPLARQTIIIHRLGSVPPRTRCPLNRTTPTLCDPPTGRGIGRGSGSRTQRSPRPTERRAGLQAPTPLRRAPGLYVRTPGRTLRAPARSHHRTPAAVDHQPSQAWLTSASAGLSRQARLEQPHFCARCSRLALSLGVSEWIFALSQGLAGYSPADYDRVTQLRW